MRGRGKGKIASQRKICLRTALQTKGFETFPRNVGILGALVKILMAKNQL